MRSVSMGWYFRNSYSYVATRSSYMKSSNQFLVTFSALPSRYVSDERAEVDVYAIILCISVSVYSGQ